ncbi:hypothetical protein LTR85_003312 [Meristemomyces frigidus]|nr:hypothetical protein LTR85_003312 [Meristemomyces frigidus]
MANGNLAMVPHGMTHNTNGDHTSHYTAADAVNLKHGHASPPELIMHESIRGLLAEVDELRERCNGLETTNGELMHSMQKLEQAYCNELVRAPLTKANLTGYAPSEVSSPGTSSETEEAANSRNALVEQKFAAVGEILNQYYQRLNAQTAQQEKLEKTITELTAYKLSSEALFGALKDEFDGLNVAEADHSSSDFFGGGQNSVPHEIATDFMDKHERLEGRFNILELKAEEAKADLGDFKDRLDTVTDAIEAGVHVGNASSISRSGSGGVPSVYGNSEFAKHVQAKIELLQERQNTFKTFRNDVLRKFKHEQIIDNAPTKDALYSLFKTLEGNLHSDGQRRRAGPFEGDFDELLQLRDRIIYRLSIFDAYGMAFKEAQKAAKNVD